VVVPGGEVADVQDDPGAPGDLSHLSLRGEPIGDSTLIEDFDGARPVGPPPAITTACSVINTTRIS
jgi:hypothetical protein